MSNRPVRGKSSGSVKGRKGQVVLGGKWASRSSTGAFKGLRADRRVWTTRSSGTGVFIGLSVDGKEEKFVKVASGDVTKRKPSFA